MRDCSFHPERGQACCPAAQDNGAGYLCSREAGHPGNHVACGADPDDWTDPEMHAIATWPGDSE